MRYVLPMYQIILYNFVTFLKKKNFYIFLLNPLRGIKNIIINYIKSFPWFDEFHCGSWQLANFVLSTLSSYDNLLSKLIMDEFFCITLYEKSQSVFVIIKPDFQEVIYHAEKSIMYISHFKTESQIHYYNKITMLFMYRPCCDCFIYKQGLLRTYPSIKAAQWGFIYDFISMLHY